VVVAASVVAHSGFGEVATAFPINNEEYSSPIGLGRLTNDVRSKIERAAGSGEVQGVIRDLKSESQFDYGRRLGTSRTRTQVCLILDTRPLY
jgi:hypothetical protein